MASTAQQLLRDTQTYAMLRLPANAITVAAGILAQISEPFCALLVDAHDVTLILPAEAEADFAPRLAVVPVQRKGPFALITLDVALPPDAVGVLRLLTGALADANIPVLALSAFTRDHVLVADDQADAALNALNALRGA